jgi:glycosyltransferase involved in cell wall biosynthesis
MKVLVVHNAYKLWGGEDVVVRNEIELLRKNQDFVYLHSVSNEQVFNFWGKLKAALGVIFSFSAYKKIRCIIKNEKPDVVHVHNFFPLISPAVFYACRAERVPVVMTLHNYRVICPTALLMHNGRVTEYSLNHGPWWSVRARVYRNSVVGSFMLSCMIVLHQRIGTWRNLVNRFIVLSDFGLDKFVRAGLPALKLMIKPNFVDIDLPAETIRSGFLFVGRISPEKGIDVLLSAALLVNDAVVSVAGAGPLAQSVCDAELKNIKFLGSLPSHSVHTEMGKSIALLVPSIWYETFGMVVIEAYACGLPVIASRIGALGDLIEDGVTGLLCEPGNADDLAAKINWAQTHFQEMAEMGLNARARYEALYTPQKNYQQLMSVYRAAINDANKKLNSTEAVQ